VSHKIKKNFRVKIIVRDCNVIFKEGLEPGVLGYRDIEFNLTDEQYNSPMFAKELLDHRNSLLNDIIKVDFEFTP
jgi:hypothetical protein